jgi:hypothetical protein
LLAIANGYRKSGIGVLCGRAVRLKLKINREVKASLSDSSVLIEQWAHCIQMSKVLQKASGYWSDGDELEGAVKRENMKRRRKKRETK